MIKKLTTFLLFQGIVYASFSQANTEEMDTLPRSRSIYFLSVEREYFRLKEIDSLNTLKIANLNLALETSEGKVADCIYGQDQLKGKVDVLRAENKDKDAIIEAQGKELKTQKLYRRAIIAVVGVVQVIELYLFFR